MMNVIDAILCALLKFLKLETGNGFFENINYMKKSSSSIVAPTFGAAKPLPGQPGYKFVHKICCFSMSA